MESPQTDAWRVALGKGDLMQKEELEKTKNWLVGDEKGVKLRACLVYHLVKPGRPLFGPIQ